MTPRKQDLFKKYGGFGSWAVVSGGSDGIGLEYCKELARQGFNICMVARNEQKMIEKLAEVKEVNSAIETKYIVANFFEMKTFDQYQRRIQERV